ncbi:endo-1,4-beta-xylanase [Bacteroides sp. UBA939]|uniref:endo-1,4-beta-xylanase n=1 Tax=Bacteroides sp. UBA939 TaxID=1946092 RepID=UPI0025BA1FBF|nr:endo-1,4-beta-xylanase [Bacteroides sp. UBA939]
MNKKNNMIWVTLVSALLVSCVDTEIVDITVNKPTSIEQYEYLKEYAPLKSYIDRAASPGFKLGIALSANEFLEEGLIYRLAQANFDDMTAGNEMKYASCVNDQGEMNFGTVDKFVTAAQAAGITIYGHTLAWHAQQNNKYLNSLIKDKEMDADPDAKLDVEDYIVDYSESNYNFWNQIDAEVAGTASIGRNAAEGCLEIKSSVAASQNYFIQYHIADGLPTEQGKDYKLTVMIKGSSQGRLPVGVGTWGGRAEGGIDFDTEWKEVEFSFKAVDNGGHVMAQSGLFVGTIQIKYVKISHSEAPAVNIYTDMVVGGDAEGTNVSSFFSTEQGVGGPKAITIGESGTGADGVGHAFVIQSGDNPPENHSTQFFVKADRVLNAGDVCKVSFMYRADKNAGSESQTHVNPGEYIFYDAGVRVDFTSEWKLFEKEFSVTTQMISSNGNGAIMPFQTIAWNLAVLKEANTYYIDDFKWQIVTKGNTIPLTPEEKKDTLTWAMNTWVEGMMKATGGYVTAWDVVNEAISGGGDDGEGFYPLHSVTNVSEADAQNNFYWQDYLGSVDYVRIVVAAARKYYAENGGTNPLKLFVNDYNLESDWDDNKKVKSLVHWIEKWEADGVTKIDGIGTQMHVTCYANANTQRSKEEHVVQMFEILANSGKLVKITELDMGYEDENGNSVQTANMTEAQHKAMAEYYKFIIKKYFEIIPAAQQYGITQWCIADSPTGSGWRAGEPVGLWDANYSRKHTYAGFADGLAGK